MPAELAGLFEFAFINTHWQSLLVTSSDVLIIFGHTKISNSHHSHFEQLEVLGFGEGVGLEFFGGSQSPDDNLLWVHYQCVFASFV